MEKTLKVAMEFTSLCDRCPVEKMCELVVKRFEVVTCDAHDFAVKELKKQDYLSKTLKVTIELEDRILSLEGMEAEKWGKHCEAVGTFAAAHNQNPFDYDRINWTITLKESK